MHQNSFILLLLEVGTNALPFFFNDSRENFRRSFRIQLLVSLLLFFLFPASECSSPILRGSPKTLQLRRVYKYGEKIFDDFDNCNVGVLRSCKVDKIYQLGDSISDVGNLIRETNDTAPFATLPYGKSFPEGPTGRASNGNLIIDYLAMDAGLPLLPPFKKSDADFSHGVNFAVTGSTALPWEALADLNISSSKTNNSLSVQLDWMSQHLDSICKNLTDCGGKLENAVSIVGPFGGSDYFNALFQDKTMHEIRTELLPQVVDAIMAAVRRLISMGAKRVVVPGVYSIYQLPLFQMTFSGKPDMYEWSDDLAIHHNVRLRDAIDKLNHQERPNAVVAFADYYSDYDSLRYYAGVKEMEVFKASCGSGGGYFNLDLTRMCGGEGVSALHTA